MNPEPAKSNDDWFHDDCPACRQLKAMGIEMYTYDDDEEEDVAVTVTYSLALQEITGKAMESIMVAEGMPFMHFLLDIFEAYPEIEKRYPPGTVGMLVNDEPPTEDYLMKNGDTLTLRVLRPEYWGQIPDEGIKP